MFTPTQTHAINLLGQGISQVQVAKALALSESEVSRFFENPEFKLAVSEAKIENLTAATKRDNTFDKLEDALADKLNEQLPFVTQPMVTGKLLQMVNGLKRRGASNEDKARVNSQTTVVVLQLPEVTKQKFEVNNRNEVVQVGDRPMVTIDSNLLLNSTMKENDNDKLGITEI